MQKSTFTSTIRNSTCRNVGHAWQTGLDQTYRTCQREHCKAAQRLIVNRPSDLADLYRVLVSEGKMVGYVLANRFYEIGTPEALEETRQFLGQVAPARGVRSSAIVRKIQIDPPLFWSN